jgi:hypothetical protein
MLSHFIRLDASNSTPAPASQSPQNMLARSSTVSDGQLDVQRHGLGDCKDMARVQLWGDSHMSYRTIFSRRRRVYSRVGLRNKFVHIALSFASLEHDLACPPYLSQRTFA